MRKNKIWLNTAAAMAVLLVVGCNGGGESASQRVANQGAGASGNGEAPIGNSVVPAKQTVKPTRYAFNNQCIALQEADTNRVIATNAGAWRAQAGGTDAAEGFYFKPASLGSYLLYTQSEKLLTGGQRVGETPLAEANPNAIWTLRAVGDNTAYPPAPDPLMPASGEAIARYVSFVEPNIRSDAFTLQAADGRYLAVMQTGDLTLAETASAFTLVSVQDGRCAEFPEAQSNVDGDTFADKGLLGWADTHLHATSMDFLGGAKPGRPFHPFGVTHALANCDAEHGPTGHRDVVGSLFTGDVDGHATDGWPTFSEWPSRTATTHEATYWKWIERAWKSGLRLVVNFAVENETLCEIQRNVAGEPTFNCNEMLSAKRQLNASWAMQDYIDAQYGGRGEGWWRVVTRPEQARDVIAQGKVAVLLGVEVSNLMDCSVTFNPANTQEGFEETTEPGTGQIYGCSMQETGAANEIVTQLMELQAIGVSNLFTVHEFDNAFGGSDIFDGLVLNLGTKENSGGISDIQKQAGLALAPPEQSTALGNIEPIGVATGEFWTTHNCPAIDSEESEGSIFPMIGAAMTNIGPPPPLCAYTGRGGRPGGKTACYPEQPQCNARTLTPMGLYAFGKIMEMGFNFEIDHLGYEMKNQLLDLADAQQPVYPTVSAHGFSGLTGKQAKRIYAGGGLVYPTYNDTADLMDLWGRLKQAWRDSGSTLPFAFGWGSDTNGLSPQANPRSSIEPGKEVNYPFTLFAGDKFKDIPAFAGVKPLVFEQPATMAPNGQGRTWHVDTDGNAHYGMAADSVAELNIEAPTEMLADVYHSAEVYVKYWQRSLDAAEGVRKNGLKIPEGLLHAAPR